MNIKKRWIKGVSSLSLFGLIMSNMSYVKAEDLAQQLPIITDDKDPNQGILVTNSENNLNTLNLTEDMITALKEKGKKALDAEHTKAQKDLFKNKETIDVDTHKPDDLVSVIVQLKGQTASEMTSGIGVSQMSISTATSLVQKDIQSTKNEIMSSLSISKVKSDNGLNFKQEYTNVFKGFSIDNIKYGDIDTIKSLSNVKAVTLQNKYYPAVNQQHELTGIKNVWNGSAVGQPSGYKGEGMVVAIVDTGVDYTHEAFPDPKDMSKARIKTGKFKRDDGTTSHKVVDGYDWADQDSDVIPHVELPDSNTSSHGVHVAGIAAGSGPVIQGVAPEAQIIAEKVFSDYSPGAFTEDIIKGIDHAASLGADVINMSLGSSSSFDTRDPNDPMGIAIRNATDEGHVVVVAAGNASNAYADRVGGMGQSIKIGQTPDLNKIGNPGVYPDSFTVAAANNIVSNHKYTFTSNDALTSGGTVGSFTGDGLDDWHWNNDASKEYKLVSLGKNTDGTPKVGQPSDYSGLDVTGKIVLIQRGTINMTDKVVNAQKAGAAGVIIYNAPGKAPLDNPIGFGLIPFTFISNDAGVKLEDAYSKLNTVIGPGPGPGIGGLAVVAPKPLTLKITNEKIGSAFSESNPGEPTDFTSWGTTSDLLLKPEIMAPGHAIYSSVRVTADKHDTYENEDGTSMAAPYVTGAVADVMQGLIAKGFQPGTRAFAQLTKNLIMNTAIPAKRDYINDNNPADRQDYMTEYQPRRQGAGMIRPDLALKSPVVVTNKDGTGSVSLREIGDTTTFTITAQNLTDKAVTYKLNGTVMTDVLKDSKKANSDNIRSRYLDDAKLTFDENEITIPANTVKRVNVTVSLADTTTKNTFIEGYVYLTPTDQALPTLNVPYNGFYGKWDEPNVIDTKDTNVWTASTNGTQLALQTPAGIFGYETLFGPPRTPGELALGDKYYVVNGNLLPIPIVALLRNARNLKVDVVDKDHNLITHLANNDWVKKTDPYSGGTPGQVASEVWPFWNEAVEVPDGQYYFALTATADAPNAKPQKTVYIPMYKDTTAPKMNITRSADYDEKTHPETTDSNSYTVRWKMDDGDAGNVDGNVFMALNGSEQDGYQQNVKQSADGTYELTVNGLVEGLNVIHVAPVDKIGNMGDAHTIIVRKTSKHVWIDTTSATLNDNIPSMKWEANVKPGDSYSLGFKAVGATDSVKKIQAVILKNYYDNSTIVGDPIDIDMAQSVTQTPYFSNYSEYSIKGNVTIPSTLPKGAYAVKFLLMAEGEKWNDPGVPAIGIETYVDTDAPTITSLNTTSMRAVVKNDGDPVALMLNASVKDAVSNSRGYKVEYSVDGGAPKSMGAYSTYSTTSTQTFRYPVVLPNASGQHDIKIIATDTLGNKSEYPLTVNVAATKVTVNYTLNGQSKTQDIAIQKIASSNIAPTITLVDSFSSKSKIYDSNYVFNTEGNDPSLMGYIQTPNGNLNSTDTALAPILIGGNSQNRAQVFYTKTGIPSWNIPADSYTFSGLATGYNDIGAYPQGDSDIPVTMVDCLGNETPIKVKLHKNAYIPKVKLNDAIIDNNNNQTATFFTYDSNFTVKGTITGVQDRFFATWTDWQRVGDGFNANKNLFDPTSDWGKSPTTSAGEIYPGYENDPGVKSFSFNTGELKPGPNYFEIDGGSIVGSNPAKTLGGTHPLVKNVVVYRLGTAEGADLPLATIAANALTWDKINGENKDQSLILTNLALPNYDDANHSVISWSSSNPAVIRNDGTVIRTTEDTNVTLTATVLVGGASIVKTFDVTVAAKEVNDEIAANEDASNITWDVIRGDNTDLNNLTDALSLPTFGSNGSRIVWTSDDQKHVTNKGNVYKPLFDEDDAHVELVAKITRNTSTVYKTFNVTVLKDTANKERTLVLRAFHEVQVGDLLGENKVVTDITKDLNLPTTYGNDGVTITWQSSDPSVIAPDGKVTRPAKNTDVTLTAIYRLGNASIANQFGFVVRSEDSDNSAIVQAAKASLVWNLIKKENTDSNAVTTNLNLPTNGSQDTTITWSSSEPSVIKEDGTVTRPTYEAGDKTVTLTATISKGSDKTTKEFTINVLKQEDHTAPTSVVINPIGDNDEVLTGKTEANATVIVKIGNEEIGTGKADSNGSYQIQVGKQKAGTVLSVTAKDLAGNESDAFNTTVLDKTAPSVVVNPIGDNDVALTGKTEANATIIVKIGNNVVGSGKADSNGSYQIQVGKQKAGTVLSVSAKDSAGNESNAFDTIVLDKTAPSVPVINPIGDNDVALTGKTEANATITVQIGSNVIGSGKADSNGNYQIQVGKLKAGTILTVTAKDQAGNESGASNTIVLDKTAPTSPVINPINDKDETLTGKTEANTTITVKNGSNVIGSGKADSIGAFKITISKQKAGTVLSVTAKDQAGNESVASKTTVLDRTAPKAPSITSVSVSSKTGIQINGKAEANATIVISIGSKVVSNVKVSSYGTFAAKLPKQKAGKISTTLHAVDKAGNKSGKVVRQVTVK
ncbi:Ig-like domain-containing protein [Gottfriedia acidiceleris]|uniref:Ig-like domain-containing protein n=1 Tax=Gottfriedia acidiceleris TaxID=371036 RepID=UPI00101D7987|nr:Ig-like domain-containing protein [Gottfriedia acidiceleris]